MAAGPFKGGVVLAICVPFLQPFVPAPWAEGILMMIYLSLNGSAGNSATEDSSGSEAEVGGS